MDNSCLYRKYQNLRSFESPVRSFIDRSYDDDTLLHIAALQGNDEDLEFMLRHINLDNIDIKGEIGNAPLVNAIIGKNNECVRLLLSYGADPNALNNHGDTSFDWVVDDEEVLQIFKDFGFEKPV